MKIEDALVFVVALCSICVVLMKSGYVYVSK